MTRTPTEIGRDRSTAELIAGLTPKKRAELQAHAHATDEWWFVDVVNQAAYWVNILGSPAEEAHLINNGWPSTLLFKRRTRKFPELSRALWTC